MPWYAPRYLHPDHNALRNLMLNYGRDHAIPPAQLVFSYIYMNQSNVEQFVAGRTLSNASVASNVSPHAAPPELFDRGLTWFILVHITDAGRDLVAWGHATRASG